MDRIDDHFNYDVISGEEKLLNDIMIMQARIAYI